MKKIFLFTLATILLSSQELLANARKDNPPIVNGQPCVEEVCLRDEVKSLDHIKWKKLSTRDLGQPSRLNAIGDANAIKTFSRYLTKIDGTGLQALTKIKGFCINPILGNFNRLEAEYINKKGQPVVVYFSIVPSEDKKSQQYIVSSIVTYIRAENLTTSQYDDVVSQAKQKYPKMVFSPVQPTVSVLGNTKGIAIKLDTNIRSSSSNDAYLSFPGCGGDKKIKI